MTILYFFISIHFHRVILLCWCFLHVRCTAHQNSQWLFRSSVCLCVCVYACVEECSVPNMHTQKATHATMSKTSLRIFHRPTIMIKSVCRHSAGSIFGGKIVSYSPLTLTGFCALKRVGYWHAFFFVHSVARVCPVSARMSFSWHSQRHCWLLIYIHNTLLGLPPTVL